MALPTLGQTDWSGIITAVSLLITAIGTVLNSIMAHWTRKEVAATAGNIQKIETATNSMKDALVIKTGEAAHAAGLAEGRATGEATAAAAIIAAERKTQ